MPYSHTIKTNLFQDSITEPCGDLELIQKLLGYASLPLRLRRAVQKKRDRYRGSHTINIYYDPQSKAWQRYLYGPNGARVSESDAKDQQKESDAKDRRRDLEVWLTENLQRARGPGTPSSFMAVGIHPANQLTDPGRLGLNISGELFETLLDHPADLWEHLASWLTGSDVFILPDRSPLPTADFTLFFVEPYAPGKRIRLNASPLYLEARMLPCEHVVRAYPLVGDRHASLYWGGGRFWITPLPPYCLYTGGCPEWNLLRPGEYRPLPVSVEENDTPLFILLGQIDENRLPIRGSAILQYLYLD